MDVKQQRLEQPEDKPGPVIHLRGKSCTLAEANALAMEEYNRGNIGAVADIYNLILTRAPDHAGVYNNLGVVLQEMQQFEGALASYDKAIALKPDFAEARYNRGVVLQALKRFEGALASYDRAIALKPGYAEAYNNRGVVLQALKRFDAALVSCDRAIALKAAYAEAYNNRAVTLQEMQRYNDALASCDKAIALKADYAEAYNTRGYILQKLRLYDEALASCDKAIALKPGGAEAYQNRGLVLVSKGSMQEAEAMFLEALALNPDFADPLASLTNIRKYRDADHADITRIRTLLDKPATSMDDKESLYFALGKIYDDCRLYDDAFESYRQANRIRNAAVPYSPDEVTGFAGRIIEVFSADFLARPLASASDSRSPLFIVGMPRSGTTLMASILSSHRSVATAGELPTIRNMTLRLPELIGNDIVYPQAVKHITPAIWARLAHEYETRLRRDAPSGVLHIIDKHPLNFWHLGFISLLFPKARIMHCTRHPLDTGLSNYFQRFASDYNYAFDLRNIGHFYRQYARIMEHWRKVLPVNVMDVSYEDMTVNTEQTVRSALDFLGLEWDERCLAPHTNPYAVETASNWQVRQPIYRQSVERWRHYEKYLAPLKDVLELKGHR